MTTAHTNRMMQRLRRAALPRDGGGRSDGQLLELFVGCREEAAFAALVRRHGPMVLGVCRRIAGHEQDAEDAFQATFLVLARKAHSVRPREAVGNWLYGVACRTARKARAAAARRRSHECQLPALPHPPAGPDEPRRDLTAVLDQELTALPDKFRLPVVLCDLEGRTRREVARQLGLPDGTLSNRLTSARQMLARRLARRGVTLAAGPAALAAVEPASAVPPLLFELTVSAGSGAAPAVAELAEGVMRGMV